MQNTPSALLQLHRVCAGEGKKAAPLKTDISVESTMIRRHAAKQQSEVFLMRHFHYLNLCFLYIRLKTVLIAQAEAEKIKRIGEAEASAIEAVGKAEAEKMRLKAEAYQQYGEAAKTALVLEALPKVPHREVLSKHP